MNGVGGKNGPDLGRVARPWSFYDLAAAMWNHLPHMSERIWASGADRPYLTPYEMSDLIAFLYAPNAFNRPGTADGGERFFAESGDPQRGEQLVTSKGCLACHALPGEEARGKIGRGFDRLKGSGSPWIVSRRDVEPLLPHGAHDREPAPRLATVDLRGDGGPPGLPCSEIDHGRWSLPELGQLSVTRRGSGSLLRRAVVGDDGHASDRVRASSTWHPGRTRRAGPRWSACPGRGSSGRRCRSG